MIRPKKAGQGVTLLEIMLVLAIAAMVIVMSIRYYQSATTSEQVNMAMEEIQAIMSAADNLAMGAGAYSGTVSTAVVTTVVGTNNMISPLSGAITVGTTTTTSYAVSVPLNAAVCASVSAKLAAISKIQNASPAPGCATGGTLTYVFDNTK